MALHRSVLVARLLWIIPVLLLFLTINQCMVALDLRQTVNEGRSEMAEVLSFETTDRADITMASVRLRLPIEETMVERELPLPITFVQSLKNEGSDSLQVYIEPGADQEIVIAEIGRAQWHLAAINGGMSLIALALVSWGVFAWNRYLAKEGDPADAVPAE